MSEVAQQAAVWDRWAQHYDDDSRGHLVPDDAVETLTRLAAGGPAMELGVGTGRVALPLAERGVPVVGVDASPEMIKRLLTRRGDLPVDAHLGDMATINLPGPFRLVYTVASTFFLLLTQQRQVECFHSVAKILAPDGRFVIEAAVPRTLINEPLLVRDLDDNHAKISIHSHDSVQQIVRSQEIRLAGDGTWRMLPAAKRYGYPAELDLMGHLAGLHPQARWADWRGASFNGASSHHVTTYKRAE